MPPLALKLLLRFGDPRKLRVRLRQLGALFAAGAYVWYRAVQLRHKASLSREVKRAQRMELYERADNAEWERWDAETDAAPD